QGEHAFRQTTLLHRFTYGTAHQLGGAGVGGMPLDDDGRARCEGSSRITTCNGECQREIACAEHRYGAYGNVLQTQIAAWQRLTIRHSGVNPRIDPGTTTQFARKQTQLTASAAPLTLQAGDRQAGLAVRTLDQRITQRLNPLGDLLQKAGALFQRGVAVDVESLCRESAGGGHIILRAARKRRIERLVGSRVNGMNRSLAARDITGPDQHLTCNLHGVSMSLVVKQVYSNSLRCQLTSDVAARGKPNGFSASLPLHRHVHMLVKNERADPNQGDSADYFGALSHHGAQHTSDHHPQRYHEQSGQAYR